MSLPALLLPAVVLCIFSKHKHHFSRKFVACFLALFFFFSCCRATPNRNKREQDSQAQNSQLRSRQDAFGGPRERERQGRVRVGRLDKPGQGRGPVVRRFRAEGGSADDLVRRSAFGVRFQADGGEKKREFCMYDAFFFDPLVCFCFVALYLF